MADKEYRARIRIKLSDDLLPHPLLSVNELESLLNQALKPGEDDSPISSISVDDPRTDTRPRRY